MTLDHTPAQTTGQSALAPTHKACVTERLLPVCCICGLIRDELRKLSHRVRWMTPQIYRTTYDVNPAKCLLTHTYCPKCFATVREAARRSVQQSET